MITNVRIGNDIKLIWQILKGGQPVDLTGATDVKVSVFQGGNSSCGNVYIDTFKITDAVNGILSVEIPKEVITEVGYMWTVLEYTLHDDDMIDGDRKVTVDNVPVRIVSLTAEASQVYEFNVSSDILAGFHGKSAFEVWLDENPDKTIQDYFDWLQQPATAIATEVSQAEALRVTAEQGRVEAEIIREQQEEDRQINTATAILNAENAAENANTAAQNAENAAENANTAAQNADDARLAIQDDLALKADQADLAQLESNVSVKVRNLLPNGDFVNGVNGWSVSGSMTVEHDNGRLRSYNWLSTSNRIISPAMEGLSIGDLLYLRIGEYERSAIPASGNLILARINDTVPSIISESNNPNLIIKNLSGIAAYNGETPRIHIRTYQGEANSVWIDDVVCINLTETFGAGNEPTKEEMDLLISILGIDYFEGEMTIPAQKIMQWQLALIRKNKNAIIALGGTII